MSSTTTKPPTATTTTDPNEYCRTTEWYILLAASLGAYVLGLLIFPILHILCSSQEQDDGKPSKRKRRAKASLLTRMHLACQALIRGANTMGKVLLVLYTICVMVSFVIYVLMTYQFTDQQSKASRTLLACFTANQFPVVHVEFGLNVFYCVMFVLRLLSSESLLSFWLTIDTFADLITIIPSIIMYALDKHMIAFQFARLTGLRFLVNTLIYCKLVRTEKYIRLVSLLIQIISIWAVSAGLFQLIEVVGDFWRYNEGLTSAAFYQYHDCFYFMLITMSTVGYGDISPSTVIGKFFIILFICVALGLFTSIIPEVSDILSENKKYKKAVVHLKEGKKHVVVVAKFTPSLMKTFFADFFHSERDTKERQFVALLGSDEPDLEMKALMKTRELYVTYLQGSVMNVKDMQRARVKEASAVIILSDSQVKDNEDEDMRNIMRVIAIKDFCPYVKVLVQLQLYRSKTYLRNIPDWSVENGDEAVCVNEIKYGILAQSCMVPGLSTLLCNLLILRSCDSDQLPPFSWEHAYMHGVEYEFYRVPFSPYFHGFTFTQAAEVCIDELGITLLAVETLQNNCRRTIINPGSEIRVNAETMQAFVIACDERDAKRLTNYNPSVRAARSLRQTLSACCSCWNPDDNHDSHDRNYHDSHYNNADANAAKLRAVQSLSTDTISTRASNLPAAAAANNNDYDNDANNNDYDNDSNDAANPAAASSRFDKTVVEIQLNESRKKQIQRENIRKSRNEEESIQTDSVDLLLDSSGYFHWTADRNVETITLSMNEKYEFKNHVIVCILEKNPEVCLNLTSFLMPLRASSIPLSKMKDVVLVGKVELLMSEWPVIQNFPKIHMLNGSPLNRANLKLVNIEACHSCLILSPKSADFEPDAQMDRETVLCTLNIKTMNHTQTGKALGDIVHIITELNNEDAIAYLDQDDEVDVDEAYMTQAFATGRTFFLSLLESLITTIYFNPAALSFLRTIVTTVDSDDFEVELNEQGFHFLQSNHAHRANDIHEQQQQQQQCKSLQRSQIELLSVMQYPLADIFNAKASQSWKEFSLKLVHDLELVCIGLSRLQIEEAGSKNHRYVMTMPQDSVVVKATDWVYCLTPPGLHL